MNIITTQLEYRKKKYFQADCTDFPGSPWVGTGCTREEAVATLFIRNLDAFKRLKEKEGDNLVLTVDGRLFVEPTGQRS